jgi:Stigma-specific protein, Stig1
MKISRSIAVVLICLVPALAVGCASNTYEANNNNDNHSLPNDSGTNTNTNTVSDCMATCQGDNVCVGQPGHQTCVPVCEGGLTCTDPLRTCCYGGCVDQMNDPNNCGICAEFCDGNCINGVCVDQCGNMCTAGQDCCGGTCTTVASDMLNCGTCGTVCDTEESNACVNGTCKCGSSNACDLAAGAECCATSCKYVATDVTNCGGCGITCTIGETCLDGSCQCGSGPACTSGQGCCNGSCVALDSAQYCGSCTSSCTAPEDCYGTSCGCGGAGVVCEGLMPGMPGTCCGASGCVVFIGALTDNCGSCGNSCAICIAGACG